MFIIIYMRRHAKDPQYYPVSRCQLSMYCTYIIYTNQPFARFPFSKAVHSQLS